MSRAGGSSSGAALAVGAALGLGAAAAGALAVALLSSQKSNKAQPLTKEAWKQAHDEGGRVVDFAGILEQIRMGGCDPDVREEVWPYLLRLVSPSSTAEQRSTLRADLARRYSDLLQRCQDLETLLDSAVVRTGSSVAVAENTGAARSVPAHLAQFAEAQRIIVLDAIRTDLLQPDAASESSHRTNGAMNGLVPSADRRGGGPWLGRVAEETLFNATHLSPASRKAAARLIHLLSAYAVHDPETGYCQGMSDLAAPFLTIFEDDYMAYWCFERLLQRTSKNFRHDEVGMREQLRGLARILEQADPVVFHHLRQIGAGECFFAYRMVIVQLRRELPAVTLWEILWADDYWQRLGSWTPPSLSRPSSGSEQPSVPGTAPDLLLFFIAAVALRQRRRLIDECRDQDDTLRLFNSLRIDLWGSLRSARGLQRSLAAQYQPSSSVY
ncbi:RabGAP/TBC [Coccomyxa subellipsoidea C-169]|uniref:RabGAP/TBC n=1 Tax=Coccomyxa subellipsoidea (strain C-169) TaxID=574566 RepID=I0YVB6_COCSC|nr:RabGAP/TBC [Coccomyxa subellipsoidea C-169]EIE22335.1 RabGAP/TBC [Coccomyxa subellipsoidea C-169]|eukprot:XP_005646879.1 RabGAP/TBC [Coccomyxa subellipsoidea C-169]